MAPTPQSYHSASDIPPHLHLHHLQSICILMAKSPAPRRVDGQAWLQLKHSDMTTTRVQCHHPCSRYRYLVAVVMDMGGTVLALRKYIEMDQRGGGSYSPTSPSYQSSHHAFERSASDPSFATARDDFVHAESDIGVQPLGHLAVGDPGYGAPYDDRRASAMSWQGGRAL